MTVASGGGFAALQRLAAGAGLISPPPVLNRRQRTLDGHRRCKGSKKYTAAQIARVRELRLKLRWPWSQIAKTTGIPQGSLSYLVHGLAALEGMDPQKLIRLCQAKGLELRTGEQLSGPVFPQHRKPRPVAQKWKNRAQVVLLRDAGRSWPDIQLITKIPRATARYIYEQAVLSRE